MSLLLDSSAWLLVGTFLGSKDLIVDVLLCLYISSLIGLELNSFQDVGAGIRYTTIVALQESLVQELFERSAVSHLKEELSQLLTLFIS